MTRHRGSPAIRNRRPTGSRADRPGQVPGLAGRRPAAGYGDRSAIIRLLSNDLTAGAATPLPLKATRAPAPGARPTSLPHAPRCARPPEQSRTDLRKIRAIGSGWSCPAIVQRMVCPAGGPGPYPLAPHHAPDNRTLTAPRVGLSRPRARRGCDARSSGLRPDHRGQPRGFACCVNGSQRLVGVV